MSLLVIGRKPWNSSRGTKIEVDYGEKERKPACKEKRRRGENNMSRLHRENLWGREVLQA